MGKRRIHPSIAGAALVCAMIYVGCSSNDIAVVQNDADARAPEESNADASSKTTSDSGAVILDTACSTGPARDQRVPLPKSSDFGDSDPTCTLRCGTNYGVNDIAPFSALPNGSCTGNGSCDVLAMAYCNGKPYEFDQVFVCTCSDNVWMCAATEGWSGVTCPTDAGASDASND